MIDLVTLVTALSHAVLARLPRHAHRDVRRDRGAVSLEQVLWFVASGVAVAVVAAIVWRQIKGQAETNIDVPTAP